MEKCIVLLPCRRRFNTIRPVPPAGIKLDKFNRLRDTLFSPSISYYENALAGSGNKVFAAASIRTTNEGVKTIFLQQLQVQKIAPDSFAISYALHRK